MRQLCTTVLVLVLTIQSIGQTENKKLFHRFYSNHLKTKVEKKPLQLFAEVSPQFFAWKGYGGGIGTEFSRFQTGFIYISLELTPAFRDAFFNNAKTVTVTHNSAAELFANIFLRKDRKGFYAGTIYSYDWFSVVDDKTQQKEDYTGQYMLLRAGFRWFPFQEHFYIDGGYGISFNISGSGDRQLGESKYSAKPIVTIPFFSIGGRFSLTSKKNK